MTENCYYCGKFYGYNGEDYCPKCLEMLIVEGDEAEIGIGTGSIMSKDKIFCRHGIDFKYGRPMTHLRLLLEKEK